MSNRKIGFTVLVVAAILAVSATCYVAAAPERPALETTAPATASGRWQIYRATMATDVGKDEQGSRSAINTILLDSATGESWLLWPVEKDGDRHYAWIPIPRQKK
jgi:hypothetical protein